MKNLTKPSFLTFIAGTILVLIGVVMRNDGQRAGDYLFFLGAGLMGIFWIWSIVMVLSAPDMKPFQKRFWMIAVIAVPVLGGLVFHILHNKAGRITT